MVITININGLSLYHKGSGESIKNIRLDACKTLSGKRFNYSNEAIKLAKGKYSRALKKAGGNLVSEKSMTSATKKGLLNKATRKPLSSMAAQ